MGTITKVGLIGTMGLGATAYGLYSSKHAQDFHDAEQTLSQICANQTWQKKGEQDTVTGEKIDYNEQSFTNAVKNININFRDEVGATMYVCKGSPRELELKIDNKFTKVTFDENGETVIRETTGQHYWRRSCSIRYHLQQRSRRFSEYKRTSKI